MAASLRCDTHRGRAWPGLPPHPSPGKLAQDESLAVCSPGACPEAGHVGASSLPKFPLSSKQRPLPPGHRAPRGPLAPSTPVPDTGEVCRLHKPPPDHRTPTRSLRDLANCKMSIPRRGPREKSGATSEAEVGWGGWLEKNGTGPRVSLWEALWGGGSGSAFYINCKKNGRGGRGVRGGREGAALQDRTGSTLQLSSGPSEA